VESNPDLSKVVEENSSIESKTPLHTVQLLPYWCVSQNSNSGIRPYIPSCRVHEAQVSGRTETWEDSWHIINVLCFPSCNWWKRNKGKSVSHLLPVRDTGFETVIWELSSHVGHLANPTYDYWTSSSGVK